MHKIRVNCEAATEVEWQNLKDIQENVKVLGLNEMDKMLNSFKENGFCDPFNIWENPETQEKVCIAGNQRLKALHKAKELGWDIPDRLPADKVKATNLKEAIKMLLASAGSFGKVQRDELLSFLEKNELELESIETMTNFPELDINKLEKENKELIEAFSEESNEPKDKKNSDFEFIKLPVLKENVQEMNELILESIKQAEKDGLDIEYTPAGIVIYLLRKYIDESQRQK